MVCPGSPDWLYNGPVMSAPNVISNPSPSRRLPPVQRSMEPLIFHRRVAGYEATPLRRLAGLAGRLGIRDLLVKDESDRFGLNSFKILGDSWAIYRLLSRKLGLALGSWEGLEELYALLEPLRPLELIAASDGNHGRAVASMAERLGIWARVFVPENTGPFRIDAIRSHGAEVIVTNGTMDEAVAAAAAAERAGAGILVQDTGRGRIREIPGWIMDGYDTLFQEVDEQIMEAGAGRPDLMLVQVGAGSLAAAAIRHYASLGAGFMPRILGVEPEGAAAVPPSLKAGEPVPAAETRASLMAGMNGGTLSAGAWPWIQGGLDGLVLLDDLRARRAADEIRAAGLDSTEAGAAGLGGLLEICSNPSMPFVRERARLHTGSTVLLINTEGDSGNRA